RYFRKVFSLVCVDIPNNLTRSVLKTTNEIGCAFASLTIQGDLYCPVIFLCRYPVDVSMHQPESFDRHVEHLLIRHAVKSYQAAEEVSEVDPTNGASGAAGGGFAAAAASTSFSRAVLVTA